MAADECGRLTQDQLSLLLIWFSPSFPIGSFAYSHGLESAVEKGSVTDADSLSEWIGTVLLHGSGVSDGVIFREAHTAVAEDDADRLHCIAELSDALLPTEELALECRAQGAAFLAAGEQAWPTGGIASGLTRPTYPVAAGAVCASYGIPLGPSLTSWYQASASGLVSAGVRLVPLGQTDGLKVLASLSDSLRRACRQARTVALDDAGSSAPLLEIDSIHHETQYTRLFRS